jgi:hypothetical protein
MPRHDGPAARGVENLEVSIAVDVGHHRRGEHAPASIAWNEGESRDQRAVMMPGVEARTALLVPRADLRARVRAHPRGDDFQVAIPIQVGQHR